MPGQIRSYGWALTDNQGIGLGGNFGPGLVINDRGFDVLEVTTNPLPGPPASEIQSATSRFFDRVISILQEQFGSPNIYLWHADQIYGLTAAPNFTSVFTVVNQSPSAHSGLYAVQGRDRMYVCGFWQRLFSSNVGAVKLDTKTNTWSSHQAAGPSPSFGRNTPCIQYEGKLFQVEGRYATSFEPDTNIFIQEEIIPVASTRIEHARIWLMYGRLFALVKTNTNNLKLMDRIFAGGWTEVYDFGVVTGIPELWDTIEQGFDLIYYTTSGGSGFKFFRVFMADPSPGAGPSSVIDYTNTVIPDGTDNAMNSGFPLGLPNYRWPAATNGNNSTRWFNMTDHVIWKRGAFGASGGVFADAWLDANDGTNRTQTTAVGAGVLTQPLRLQSDRGGPPWGATNHDRAYGNPTTRWGQADRAIFPNEPVIQIVNVEPYSDGSISRGMRINFHIQAPSTGGFEFDAQILYGRNADIGKFAGGPLTPLPLAAGSSFDRGGAGSTLNLIDNSLDNAFIRHISGYLLSHGVPSVGAGYIPGETVTSSGGGIGIVRKVSGSPINRIGITRTNATPFGIGETITGGSSGTISVLSANEDNSFIYSVLCDLDAAGIPELEWILLLGVCIGVGVPRPPVSGTTYTGPVSYTLVPRVGADDPLDSYSSPIHETVALSADPPQSNSSPIHETTPFSTAVPQSTSSPIHETIALLPIRTPAVGNAYTTCFVIERDRYDAVAEAETDAYARLIHAVPMEAEGVADVDAGFSQQLSAVPNDVVGEAYTNANAFYLIDGSVNPISGEAFTTMNADKKTTIDPTVLAEAIAEIMVSVESTFEAPVEANAFTTLDTDLLQQTIPSSITLSNSAEFQLTVAGTVIPIGSTMICPEDLSVSYDGKELSFSEISTGGIGNPSFSPEDAVTLDVDLGMGLFRWFTGAIRTRETVGQNNNEGFSYVAFGYQNLSDEVTLVNTDGRPEIEFTVGTTVTSVRSDGTDVVTSFSKSIADAMQEIFEINSANLAAAGIPSTIGLPGLGQFTSNIPETLQFQNVGFRSAISQLAQLETGVKPFWNDQQLAWTFPNLLQSPTAIVQINSVCMTELVFDSSTEDRYTAVRLLAEADDFIDEAIISKTATVAIGGNTGVVQRTEVVLQERWLPELEDDWTISKAHQGALGTLEDEFFWVYRRWSLPEGLVPKWPGTPVRLWQKFNFWGVETWRRTHGVVNFKRREFHSRFPLIHRGNPHIPGDVIGPIEVRMAYFPRQFNFTYITTTNSAGTPTFATTEIDGASFPSEIRVPDSGFEGTAFTQFGVQRELVQIVSRTEVTTENAENILRLHKDVVIAGDVPIEGDPLEVMLNLDKKVRVQHATLVTGIESVDALLTGYTYRFGKLGVNNLQFTTDVAGLIAGTV